LAVKIRILVKQLKNHQKAYALNELLTAD